MSNNRYRLMAATLLAGLLTSGAAWGQTRIGGSVYGGGALANTANTEVNLLGGTIEHDVYGGGMGSLEVDGEENITGGVDPIVGSTTINLNKGVENNKKGCVVGGTIFGCNNLNGSPTGNVTVHVYKTQNKDASQIANAVDAEDAGKSVTGAKEKGRYDVTAVYGGGNLAAYIPTSGTAKAQVIIEGCDLTSIGAVYGGGNAASAPATQVDVYGCYEIGEVFGGGNGKDAFTVTVTQNTTDADGKETMTEKEITKDNPGANVGYKDYSAYETSEDEDKGAATKALREKNYKYGAGTTEANIYGGTVHSVFGGSNTKGNIRVSSAVTLDQEADGLSEGCAVEAGEVFGAGRSAAQDGSSDITLGCISGLEEIYGGSYNANVDGKIELTVTGGTIKRVFGGNNQGGAIGGTITVNIEETQCNPLIIGSVFGGGNEAAYTAPEGQPGPTVNVKSCTSIGEVFGGGFGASATVTGDTYIYIDESLGRWAKKIDNKLGPIGSVYGGGDAADVEGNTNVYIGTRIGEDIEYVSGTEAKRKAEGVNITGNVFGGGNNAKVTGNANVFIGKARTKGEGEPPEGRRRGAGRE